MSTAPHPRLGRITASRAVLLGVLVGSGVTAGSVLGVFYLVPVQHQGSQFYSVLVPVPLRDGGNNSTCTPTIFYQAGTFDFQWTEPTGDPTILLVTDPAGNWVYYHMGIGGTHGSFEVTDPNQAQYTFCAGRPAGTLTLNETYGLVVSVEGNVEFPYFAPML